MMGPEIWATIAAVVAAGLAWMSGRTAKSGKIATSEAADLWKEGSALRDVLRAEVVAAKAEVAQLKAENLKLLEEKAELLKVLIEVQKKAADEPVPPKD